MDDRKRFLSTSFDNKTVADSNLQRSKSVRFDDQESSINVTGFKDDKQQSTKRIQSTVGKVNEKMSSGYEWIKTDIEDKRRKGTRVKIKWINTELKIQITIKIALIDSSLELYESDCIVQLESTNIELQLLQQKKLQKQLTKILNKLKEEKQQLASSEEVIWLRKLLLQTHQLFFSKYFQKKKTIPVTPIDIYKVSENYIMYQAPVTLTWSPHGFFCFTQYKLPPLMQPIIGTSSSFKKSLENPYKKQRTLAKKYEKLEPIGDENIEQYEEIEYFNWDINEEVQFAVFKSNQANIYQSQIEEQYKRKTLNQSRMHEMEKLTETISPRLEQACKQFFSQSDTFQFRRQDKLKVFMVNDEIRNFETSAMLLFERIKVKNSEDKIVETILMNQSKELSQSAAISQNSLSRYLFVVKDLLRWKLQTNPKSILYYQFKLILMENQHFHLFLEEYFHLQFQDTALKNEKIKNLGSYMNFDEIQAQKYLLQVVRNFLYSKRQSESKDIFQSILVQTHYLRPFKFTFLLEKHERKAFLSKMIPILWVKDCSIDNFTYKMIKRILITNAKLIQFHKIMNNMIKKSQQSKLTFLQNVSKHYDKQQKNKQKNNLRRMFNVYCYGCGTEQKIYEFAQLESLRCQRCKIIQNQ